MKTISSVRFKQGETPEVTADIDQRISDELANVYLALAQNDRCITKNKESNPDEFTMTKLYDHDGVWTGTTITVKYTQAETLFLKPGTAKVEVGWVYYDGLAEKTNIARVQIDGSLIREVMTYGKHTS